MGFLFGGILAAALAFVQPPSPQPSSAPLVLGGRIMTGTGREARPVRHARVAVTGSTLTAGRTTDTDTTGAYRFDRLSPGAYHLTVQKPGFVKLEVTATPDAVLQLDRGGAIEGIVADAGGDPVMNVLVTALARPSGGGTPTPAAQTRTDDLGRYRLHSLDDGDYLVRAATDRPVIQNMGTAPGQKPPDPIDAYYPAAAVAADAKPVHVTSGRETHGIDVTLTPNPPL